MLIKEIPGAKSKILEILQYVCDQKVNEMVAKDNFEEISRVLRLYIENPRHNRKKYTMPPESDVENMELRRGWGEFDKLSDIDLWVDGKQSDLTAIFRIKLSSDISLYDIKVL